MLSSFRKSRTNIFAYALLALLVVGLIGLYGTRSGRLVAREIASVGDARIGADAYFDALNRELGLYTQQTGQRLSMAQARSFGLDRSVLGRLLSAAALDNEAGLLRISAGDKSVQEQLLAAPQFQGEDGNFSRSVYEFAIQNSELTAVEFDETLRKGIARDLLRTGISDGLSIPQAASYAILSYLGEQREFRWVKLDRAALGSAIPEPGATELSEYFQDNIENFLVPATRSVTVVKLTPDLLLDGLKRTDEELRVAYEARAEQYNSPERRMVERIVFGTLQEGSEALAEIANGSKTFESVAEERDLNASDTDLGVVLATGLDTDARELVFGNTQPGIVGPVRTSLGPAIFRINAILAGSTVTFESVRDELNLELALPDALDLIADVTSEVEDLLAGGATLEEIADETDFVLEGIEVSEGSVESLLADRAFLREVYSAEVGEERDIIGLADGSALVLRVESIVEEHAPEFSDAEADVRADWEVTRVQQLLVERADELKARLAGGEDLIELAGELSLTINEQFALPRSARLSIIPDGLVRAVFELPEDGVAVVPLADGVAVVLLSGIVAMDTGAPEQEGLIASLTQRQLAETQSDLFDYFAQAIQERDGVVVKQNLVEQILARFP